MLAQAGHGRTHKIGKCDPVSDDLAVVYHEHHVAKKEDAKALNGVGCSTIQTSQKTSGL